MRKTKLTMQIPFPVSFRKGFRSAVSSGSGILLTALAVVPFFLGCSPDTPTVQQTPSSNAISEETVETSTTEMLDLEKDSLRVGFIKLTDCAPIVIAKEKGYFEDEGLDVIVEAQSNWKVLLDRVISGELDGAHMLAGQPIAATVGFGTKAHIITPFSMDLNGNGITVSQRIWEKMQENDPYLKSATPKHPITADSLKPVIEEAKAAGEGFPMGMVFPVSTHNYEIRYWLAAAGIHPGFYTRTDLKGVTDSDVQLSVTPPPQMPTVLEQGNIHGYCVGEPWNQQAVFRNIGVPVTTNYDIWKNNPEKVYGMTLDWYEKHPNTALAMVKALIRAGKWLDERTEDGKFRNREEACRILSQRNYVGADYEIIANSMTGTFVFQKSDVREMPDFNVFFRYNATYPYYSDCIWFLTQMRRWGQLQDAQPDEWYHETAKKIYRPDIYLKAAELLLKEAHIEKADIPWDTDGFKAPTDEFIDGKNYDARKPVEYINSFKIKFAADPAA